MADIFQLVCPSDANPVINPGNTPGNFTVTFPETLYFEEDDWEVALQSISLPNTYQN